MTVAHQLTPFATIPVLALLALSGRCRLRCLPVLALLLPVHWLVLAATPFLLGHLHTLFESIGNINAAASASLFNRVGGSPAAPARLPFAASLVVLPFIPRGPTPPGGRQMAAHLLLGSVIATSTVATRYGNDAIENFTPDEIALVNQIYLTAPHGSVLIEAVHVTACRYEQYADTDTRLSSKPSRHALATPRSAAHR